MKILVSAYLKNKQNSLCLQGLIYLIRSLGNDITLLTTGYSKISFFEYQIKELNNIDSDLIIAFNKKGLIQARKLKKNQKVPLIYSFCNSEFEKEYDDKWSAWDSLIVINDDNNIFKGIFPDVLTTFLNLPYPTVEYSPYLLDRKRHIILTEFEKLKSSPLLLSGIVNIINKLPNIKFKISFKNNFLLKYLNTNALLSPQSEELAISDLVIGSGKCIEKAIACSSPCTLR